MSFREHARVARVFSIRLDRNASLKKKKSNRVEEAPEGIRAKCIVLPLPHPCSAEGGMVDRGGQLGQFSFQAPVLDALFFAALMRWVMLLIVILGIGWGMYELFRRFSLIESFNSYGVGRKLSAKAES